MIVQSAAANQPHFVIEQADHARMAGQLAAAFGNETFAQPVPRDLLIYIVAHHDEGWQAIDARCEQSPTTGLPHHLTQTPLAYLLQTSQGSPDFNEAHHPFCGLLSSMHTYGLFNGRYGLSDFIFIDRIAEQDRPGVVALLDGELARQERLKTVLERQDAAAWLTHSALMNNYKRLQFFDTLALYFHMTHPEGRGETRFLNVPDGHGHDHTLTIKPISPAEYTLTPFPFAGDALTVTVAGRYLTPQPAGTDFQAIFAAAPKTEQVYRIVRGNS